jgi:hypothetical protein
MQFTGTLDRESTLANRRLAQEAARFREGRDDWFDGTPASTDRRIAQCQRVLHAARSARARSPFDWEPTQIIAELETDLRALVGQREDLLNGYQDRVALELPWGKSKEERDQDKEQREFWRQQDNERVRKGLEKAYGPRAAAIDDDELRWARLEAPKFLRANLDVAHVHDELGTRAQLWAQKMSSGFDHPAETTRVFVGAVIAGAKALPKPRIAKANPAPLAGLPDEAMWL